MPEQRKPRIGDTIRYFAELWTIVAVYRHPRFGEFWRLEGVEDGRYELINADGADGNYEVVQAA